MNWYFKCIKNYATFSGRARRKEFWMFILFNLITSIVIRILDGVLGTYKLIEYSLPINTINGIQHLTYNYKICYISIIYSLFIILPTLAVIVRRLHDQGKMGAWIFIYLIPIIGPIWYLVLMCTEGNRNTNEYGPDPKDIYQSNDYITE